VVKLSILPRILSWVSCKPTFTHGVTCVTYASNAFTGCCNRASSGIANTTRSSTMRRDACSYNARVRESVSNFSRALQRLLSALCVSSFLLFHSWRMDHFHKNPISAAVHSSPATNALLDKLVPCTDLVLVTRHLCSTAQSPSNVCHICGSQVRCHLSFRC
jgi:hypothetical protein